MSNLVKKIAVVCAVGGAALYFSRKCIFYGKNMIKLFLSTKVESGHKAVVFNKMEGVKKEIFSEGFHLLVPFVEVPIVYDVRTKPKNFQVSAPSKDLQTVNITIRVLYRPEVNSLVAIQNFFGPKYDEMIMPSVANEVLKKVVGEYTMQELLVKRDEVRSAITREIEEKAKKYYMVLDDVAIIGLSPGSI